MSPKIKSGIRNVRHSRACVWHDQRDAPISTLSDERLGASARRVGHHLHCLQPSQTVSLRGLARSTALFLNRGDNDLFFQRRFCTHASTNRRCPIDHPLARLKSHKILVASYTSQAFSPRQALSACCRPPAGFLQWYPRSSAPAPESTHCPAVFACECLSPRPSRSLHRLPAGQAPWAEKGLTARQWTDWRPLREREATHGQRKAIFCGVPPLRTSPTNSVF